MHGSSHSGRRNCGESYEVVLFVIWCTQHQHHAIQGVAILGLPGGKDVMGWLYGASLLFGSGDFWFRLVEAVKEVVRRNIVDRSILEMTAEDRTKHETSWLLILLTLESIVDPK